MQTFEHKRVLVTGGSRGLGLGVVEALVARHADVTVLARDPRPSPASKIDSASRSSPAMQPIRRLPNWYFAICALRCSC
jgi:NAD(P)-dependent dehydrogenase (short-subunit alcohol dehydrogenase family)